MPLSVLVVAGVGGMSLRTALQAGIGISVVTLGLFALLARRAVQDRPGGSAACSSRRRSCGMIVVGWKLLAHG